MSRRQKRGHVAYRIFASRRNSPGCCQLVLLKREPIEQRESVEEPLGFARSGCCSIASYPLLLRNRQKSIESSASWLLHKTDSLLNRHCSPRLAIYSNTHTLRLFLNYGFAPFRDDAICCVVEMHRHIQSHPSTNKHHGDWKFFILFDGHPFNHYVHIVR